MKKGTIYLLIGFIVIIAFATYYYTQADSRSNVFFSDLLGVQNAKVDPDCLDYELSLFGSGKVAESYNLSPSTFDSFTQLVENKHSSRYFEKFDRVVNWTKTPSVEILNNIDLKMVLKSNSKCFNEQMLIKLLREEGNYYSLAYNSEDFYVFNIVDSNNRTIYIVENKW